MAKIPMAVQLYSIRQDCAQDLAGTLKKVAAMGYAGVEFAGFHNHPAAEVKKMLDGCGLKAAGAHVGITALLGDEFQKTVDFHRTIGNEYLVVPGLPENYRNTIDAWKKSADLMSGIAAQLKPLGLFTGYHNHTHEFTAMGGEIPWEVVASRTGKDFVMQADTGNALAGGCDVIPYIRKYPGRSRTVHLKEHSATNEKAVIGQGDIAWKAVFEACETVGATEWYIVEQESYAATPLESVEQCLKALRAMGK